MFECQGQIIDLTKTVNFVMNGHIWLIFEQNNAYDETDMLNSSDMTLTWEW